MAELVQLAGIGIGFAIGGPVGAAIGGSLGQLVGQELFGKAIEGPRIDQFRATGGAVGTPMARAYGNNRFAGELMWFGHVRTVTRTKKVGGIGGFGGQKVKEFTYFGDFAIAIQEGPGVCLRKIRIQGETWWQQPGEASGNPNYLDQQRRLLEFGPDALTAEELAQYNASARSVAASQGRNEFFTFYPGSEDQAPDATIQSYLGETAPAYRGTAYVVFKNFPLTEYGGALPLIEFETVSGPTQDEENVVFWRSAELAAWATGGFDPRGDGAFEYRYCGTSRAGTYGEDYTFAWRDTLAEALADGSADTGVDFSDATLQGRSAGAGSDGFGTITFPHAPEAIDDLGARELTFLHFNILVPTEGYVSGIPELTPPFVSCDKAFSINPYIPGDSTIWWDSRYAGGADRTNGAGVYYFVPFGADDANDIEVNISNCGRGGTVDAVSQLRYMPDIMIQVRRVAACPAAPCGTTLPENSDWCSDSDGNITPRFEYTETSDGDFIALAEYSTTASPSVVTYPLGPVLNLDDADSAARNTEANWEAWYDAAVSDGLIEAGLVYGVDYPVSISTACAATLTNDAFCEAAPKAVADVIEAEATRCTPLVLADLHTSLVTDTIWGIKFLQNPTGREAIEQLRTFSFLDVVDGAYLKFVPRGLPSVATLTLDDLGAHEYGSARPPALEVTRVDDIQLPREVRVNYIDQNADFQPGQQYDRRLVTDAVNEQTIELGIVMGADDGKRIATVSLYDQWAARKALEFKLGPRWLMLEPTDCIALPDLDGYTRTRIDRDDLALPGLRTMQGVRDEITLYDRSFEDTGATPEIPDRALDTPTIQGPTTAIILDLPPMGVGDDGPGYWVALYGVLDTWQSAEGFRSLDAGTTYDSVLETGSATAGTVLAPYDGIEMGVRVYGGELMSATAAATTAGTNRFAVGVAGRWVIGTFETATDNGGGEYTLSGLTMGLFNTAWAVGEDGSPTTYMGQAGDAFVMLETVSRVTEDDRQLSGSPDFGTGMFLQTLEVPIKSVQQVGDYFYGTFAGNSSSLRSYNATTFAYIGAQAIGSPANEYSSAFVNNGSALFVASSGAGGSGAYRFLPTAGVVGAATHDYGTAETGSARGLAIVGSSVWLSVGNTTVKRLVELDQADLSELSFIDVSGDTDGGPMGLDTDGTDLYVVGSGTQCRLSRYTTAGSNVWTVDVEAAGVQSRDVKVLGGVVWVLSTLNLLAFDSADGTLLASHATAQAGNDYSGIVACTVIPQDWLTIYNGYLFVRSRIGDAVGYTVFDSATPDVAVFSIHDGQYFAGASDQNIVLATGTAVTSEFGLGFASTVHSQTDQRRLFTGASVMFRAVTAGTAFENGADQIFIARNNSQRFVTSFGANTPPPHSSGATHIAGTAPDGEWMLYPDFIVHDVDDAWYFEQPEDGRQVRTTAGALYEYTAGSPGYWLLLPAESVTAESVADIEARVAALEALPPSSFDPDTILTDGDQVLIDAAGNVLTGT